MESVQDFIDSYNQMQGFINESTFYNTETKQRGALLGDSSTRSVQSTLSGLLSRRISTLPSELLTNLNDGNGVDTGSIQIKDRSGAMATVDLSSARTVQDVIELINHVEGVSITASVNPNGTGIQINDTSDGYGALSITDLNGDTSAVDLGIQGSTYSKRINGSAVADAEFLSLTQLGVTSNLDGTLTLNASTFQKYLDENPGAVEAFFTQEKTGFAAIAQETVNRLTDSQNGFLTTRASSLQDTIESYTDSIERINERVTMVEERLRRQFTAMETTLSQLQSQGDYLTNTLNQLTTNNKKY
jgi:flagellar hook-associated protein 2